MAPKSKSDRSSTVKVESEYTAVVSIRASRVTDNNNGTFTLHLAGKEMTEEHRKTLEQLFPNLLDRAYDLLNQEVLINALATPSEVNAEPTNMGDVYQSHETTTPTKW